MKHVDAEIGDIVRTPDDVQQQMISMLLVMTAFKLFMSSNDIFAAISSSHVAKLVKGERKILSSADSVPAYNRQEQTYALLGLRTFLAVKLCVLAGKCKPS